MGGRRLVVLEAAGWLEAATMVVGGCNNGGFRQGWAWAGQKYGGLLVNKQGQRRDFRAQHRDVPKGGVANIATFSRVDFPT